MNRLVQILTLAVMILFAAVGKAQNFYDFSAVNDDGVTIYYKIVYGDAEVTSEMGEYGGGSYSGNVTIPSSVTYSGTTYSVERIGKMAFAMSTKLTSVTLPSSIRFIEQEAFAYCTNLTSVTIPNGVNSIGLKAFQECSSLTSITIPSSVTSIGQHVFHGCSKLTAINVDSSSKHFSSQDGVLFNYDKTEIVRFPEGKTGTYTIPGSVTSIEASAFANCSGLTSITIPDGVTSIGKFAFENCSSLTSVTIPSSVTSIGKSVFHGCSKLTAINVDASNNNYSSYDGALIDKDNAEIVRCPEGKSGAYTIPSSVTSIGSEAFLDCGVTSVAIPNSVTSIGDYAFRHSGLTSVIIPNSVTSIGYYAFGDCSSLTTVTIPSSVKSMDGNVFYHCDNLTSVFSYVKDVFDIEEGVFGSYTYSTNIYENATLYVPQGTKEAYDTTAYWSNFTNIVEMVPYDVDCDGELNNTDVQAIIEKLLELFTEVFNQTAADMNGDGEIDVVDAVLMAKQILTGDNGSRSLPAVRHAADAGTASLYSENTTAASGQQATLPISLTNTKVIAGLQFDLVLPEGVTIATNADGELLGTMTSRGENLSLRGNQLDDGTYRFVAMSMEGANVSGNEGEVVNLTLDVASDMAYGDYTIEIKEVRLAEDGNEQTVVADAQTSTLTVAAPSAITAIETNAETKAYNLRGIQVKSPRRGIVIMNGQKVLRK